MNGMEWCGACCRAPFILGEEAAALHRKDDTIRRRSDIFPGDRHSANSSMWLLLHRASTGAGSRLGMKGRLQRKNCPRPAREVTSPSTYNVSPREIVMTGQPRT